MLYDHLLRGKGQPAYGVKRRTMMNDLQDARQEEDRIARRFREKEHMVSAMGSVCGDLKNPLLVMPLNKAAAVEGSSFFPPRHVEHEPYIPVVNNLVGASYPIMDKLMKEISAICFCLPQSSPSADLPLYRWYNLLGQQKQMFTPKNIGKLGMYVCGTTVYDLSHIGHARVYVSFDVLFRYLKHLEYEVCYVRNVTDVDDKKVVATVLHVAVIHRLSYLTCRFLIMVVPRVDGDVYFSVDKFPEYGQLSGRKLEDNRAGERVTVDSRKRNPTDFALWKSTKEGESFWESPWGPGRPGWHIECSAMSAAYLGYSFDIHGGGVDLVFPHHENEIAQSCAACNKSNISYWIHNGFVNIDNEKMSKSLGNFFTIRQVIDLCHPLAVRLFLMGTHYRSPINYSNAQLGSASDRVFYIYQMLLMPLLAPGLDEVKLLRIGLFAGCANIFLYSVSWSPWVPYLASSISVLAVFAPPCIRSIASKQVDPEEQGKGQGCISGMCSFANIVSPLTFTPLTALFLSERAPFHFPGFSIMCTGFAMSHLLLCTYLYGVYIAVKHSNQSQDTMTIEESSETEVILQKPSMGKKQDSSKLDPETHFFSSANVAIKDEELTATRQMNAHAYTEKELGKFALSNKHTLPSNANSSRVSGSRRKRAKFEKDPLLKTIGELADLMKSQYKPEGQVLDEAMDQLNELKSSGVLDIDLYIASGTGGMEEIMKRRKWRKKIHKNGYPFITIIDKIFSSHDKNQITNVGLFAHRISALDRTPEGVFQ
ncbi:hypothetical protein IFM89_031519 [Coptis chinensis]|uniref:cysteine--tRNA ligase n=1 Tax=Coptis chinensis TaxID=261450 RepID=A0A835ICZ6_9MAGN|nr:hypothetical protein IFM89_031519 [Coptis chinensis]